jgi:hypothetical protein
MISLQHVPNSGQPNDCVYKLVDEMNQEIARVCAHLDYPFDEHLNISLIDTHDIPKTVDAIITFAKMQGKHIVTLPHLIHFQDGTYLQDVDNGWSFDGDTRVDTSHLSLHDHAITKQNLEWDRIACKEMGEETCHEEEIIKHKQLMRENPSLWSIGQKVWDYVCNNYANVTEIVYERSGEHVEGFDYAKDCVSVMETVQSYRTKQFVPVICLPHKTEIPKEVLKGKVYDIHISLYDSENWISQKTPVLSQARGKAFIYNVKEMITDVCEDEPKKRNVIKICFTNTMIFHMGERPHDLDTYMDISINGLHIVRKSTSDFRFNKLRWYTPREEECWPNLTCKFDDKERTCICINSLWFPECSTYAKNSYEILSEFALVLKKEPTLKRKYFVVEKLCRKIIYASSDDNNDENDFMVAWIYLVHLREFIKLGEDVFKHGQAKAKATMLTPPRLKSYPKGSQVKYLREVPVEFVDRIERLITKTFHGKFQKHADGHEYFIGDWNEMVCIIDQCISSVIRS